MGGGGVGAVSPHISIWDYSLELLLLFETELLPVDDAFDELFVLFVVPVVLWIF